MMNPTEQKPPTPHPRVVRLRRLGRQIAQARDGKMSQTDLGIRVGKHLPDEVSQGAISRWEIGKVDDLGVEQIRALEIVLGLPTGALLVSSGYAKPKFSASSVQDLILGDPAIHPDVRIDALRQHAAWLETSRRLFDRDRRQGI